MDGTYEAIEFVPRKKKKKKKSLPLFGGKIICISNPHQDSAKLTKYSLLCSDYEC